MNKSLFAVFILAFVLGFCPTTSEAKNIKNKFNPATSLVDFLKEQGQSTSYKNREELAAERGIKNYRRTAKQNTALLRILKKEVAKNGAIVEKSIVDYLAKKGEDTSRNNREYLAESYGVKNYKATAKQNIELLTLLQKDDASSAKGEATTTVPIVDSADVANTGSSEDPAKGEVNTAPRKQVDAQGILYLQNAADAVPITSGPDTASDTLGSGPETVDEALEGMGIAIPIPQLGVIWKDYRQWGDWRQITPKQVKILVFGVISIIIFYWILRRVVRWCKRRQGNKPVQIRPFGTG